jgi:hypothetical protein
MKKELPELNNSKYILDQIKACIDDYINTFDAFTKKTKGGKPGTHLQNLLRGTILLSCAGLDAFLKQLVKDALIKVKENNENSKKYFQKIVERQILHQGEASEDSRWKKNQPIKDGATFIAESLLSDDPRKFVENYVVSGLLADSKQSFGSLQEIANAFGVKIVVLSEKEKEIKDLFRMRNEISHGFDVVFHNTQGKRNRTERPRDDIAKNAELVNEICKSFYSSVEVEIQKRA